MDDVLLQSASRRRMEAEVSRCALFFQARFQEQFPHAAGPHGHHCGPADFARLALRDETVRGDLFHNNAEYLHRLLNSALLRNRPCHQPNH